MPPLSDEINRSEVEFGRELTDILGYRCGVITIRDNRRAAHTAHVHGDDGEGLPRGAA
jgi:hypothetical protein